MENSKIELFTEKEKYQIVGFSFWILIWCAIIEDMYQRGLFDDIFKK